MTKVMFALHRSDLGPILLSPEFRAALASAGAQAVAVNLDDAEVAAALRFGPAAPISAVVSLWLGASDPALAIAAVTDAVGEPELHAYRIEDDQVAEQDLQIVEG